MHIKILIVLSLILLGCSDKKEERPKEFSYPKVELVSQPNSSIAGNPITLSFKADGAEECLWKCNTGNGECI